MKTRNMIWTGVVCAVVGMPGAHAFSINRGDTTFKITGYVTPGFVEPEFETVNFIADWRVRGEVSHAITPTYGLGATYSIDALATSEGRAYRDAFLFLDAQGYGRMEIGLTDSVAKKLGVGLPDVGGLRMNDQPIIYHEIRPDGAVIADTGLGDGRYAPRVNVATAVHHGVQMGASVSALDDRYDFSTDAAIKVRIPKGKVKTALSLGASYIDSPDNMRIGTGMGHLTADWRASASMGLNVQYNSWIIGATGRVVYDRHALGRSMDGLGAGIGASYDLLKYTVSGTYLFSDTGIWGHGGRYANHTAVASLRYKYSQNIDGWVSLGISTETPFAAAGIRLTF